MQVAAAPPEFTIGLRPRLARRRIPHVDEAAWPRHHRAAPSRTSPDSAISGQDLSFERTASHDRPPRREFVSSARRRLRGWWLYPKVAGLCMLPVSAYRETATLPALPAASLEEVRRCN